VVLDVLDVHQWFVPTYVTEEPPQCASSVKYLFAAQTCACVKPQIKGNERRLATMELQILELRPAAFL